MARDDGSPTDPGDVGPTVEDPDPGDIVEDPGDVVDELPDDLDISGYVGPYQFPDNSRRRIPGLIYLGLAAACVVVWLVAKDSSPVVNRGFLWAALALAVAALITISSGWRMHLTETDALVAAQQAVGFPVGHASAQQVWRGVRSRPTWRVLCYSTDEPPTRRGLVLVDAVDGRVVEQLVQDTPVDDL